MTPDVFAANRGKRLSEVDAELLPVVEKALKHWSARGDWYESIVDGASVLWLEMFEESVPDAKPKERDDLLAAFQKDLRTTLAKTSDPSTASASQAQTITEWVSTSTANHAELRAARVNQHPALRWVTRKDNRVRSSHRAIDGTTVPAGQTFKVGDVHLAYPGEPVGSPANWIHCRCILQRVGEGKSMAGNATAFTEGEAMVAAGNADEEMVDATDLSDDDMIESAGGPVPFHGVAAPTDVESGDGRLLRKTGASFRTLPLPLLWQRQSADGHSQSTVVGRIDAMSLDDETGNVIYNGEFNTTPEAMEAIQGVAEGWLRGVSVDVDQAEIEMAEEDDPEQQMLTAFSAWRIAGVTMVAIPAFEQAFIALGPADDDPNPQVDDGAEATAAYADTSAEGRRKSADAGHAMPDGSFPIENVGDLRNAIQAIGRAKNPAKAKAHIKKRARDLGHPELIPDGWAADTAEFAPGTEDGASVTLLAWNARLTAVMGLLKSEGGAGSTIAAGSVTATSTRPPARTGAQISSTSGQTTTSAGTGPAISMAPDTAESLSVAANVLQLIERFTNAESDPFLMDSFLTTFVETAGASTLDTSSLSLLEKTTLGETALTAAYAASAGMDYTTSRTHLRGSFGLKPALNDVPVLSVGAQTALERINDAAQLFGVTSNPSTEDGPGWITNRVPTARLRRYWVHGEGAAKIGWNTPHDFYRCREHLGKYVGPAYVNGTCANLHKEATGAWPGHAPGDKMSLVAAGAKMAASINLVASAAPDVPPGEWFLDPELDGPTPFTVTPEGRVFGHCATWNVCHIGFDQVCTTAPSSVSGYAYYRTGEVDTTLGPVAVGQVTMGAGHADLRAGAQAAAAHYDNVAHAVADVSAGEDAYGIWVAGALRPGLADEDVRALRAASLSGDWRRIRGNLEMVAALAVNVPGFPIPRNSIAASGQEQVALVAAGVVSDGTPPPPPPATDTDQKVADLMERIGNALADAQKAISDEPDADVEAEALNTARQLVTNLADLLGVDIEERAGNEDGDYAARIVASAQRVLARRARASEVKARAAAAIRPALVARARRIGR